MINILDIYVFYVATIYFVLIVIELKLQFHVPITIAVSFVVKL